MVWIVVTQFFSLQEDVDTFMQESGNSSAQVVLRRFDEQLNKYRFLELNLAQKRKRLVHLLACNTAQVCLLLTDYRGRSQTYRNPLIW